MPVASSILACYSTAAAIAGEQLPYVFGGGHGPGFGPTKGGYDCSGAVSAVLHGGGILEHSAPLGTHELEHWGLPGEGEYMTVWVHNGPELEHCFVEFSIPGRHKWFAASHTGTIVGWVPFIDTTGYTPRRRKA